jgi:hypothetical protein
MAGPVIRGAARQQNGVRLLAGLIAVAAWLLFGWTSGWSYLGGPKPVGAYGVAPYVAIGVLALLAGRWADRVAAWLVYLGGIAGAAVVAWAAGPVGVFPDADPNMRSSYYASLIVIAAGISAVLGAIVVWGAYWLARRVIRRGTSSADPGP